MSAKTPLPTGQIIDLLSSSPLQQSPPPTKATDFPMISSPLLPSLGALLTQLNEERMAAASAKAMKVQPANIGKVEEASVWNIPDDAGGGEVLPPPKLAPARKKQAVKGTADTAVKKPRAPRKTTVSSKVEKKKAPLKDGKFKGRVTKGVEMKSKCFTEGQPEEVTASRLAASNQFLQAVPDLLDTSPVEYPLVPKSPNQQPALNPPLHIIRRQWTPVKDTALTLDSSSPLTGSEPKKSKRSIFDDMVGVMRYSTHSLQNSREASASKEGPTSNVLRKKISIEVIGLPSAVIVNKEKPPKLPKSKQPKKRAKTITDQATAQFRLAGDPIGSPIEAYFAINESEGTDPQESSRKAGSPAKKKRKPSPEVIILLSPTSARKRFDDQDFVFGTCSQLEKAGNDEAAYDNQPEMGSDDGQGDDYMLPPPSTSVVRRDFLKTLAKERKVGSILGGYSAESDKTSTGYDKSVNVVTNCVREQPHQDARQKESQLARIRKTAGGLWNAAARDLDGELMSVEVVDMTGSDNGRLESESAGWNEGCTARRLSGNGNVTTGSNATGRSVAQNDPLESCHSVQHGHLLVEKAVYESNQIQTIESSGETSHAITSGTRGVTASLESSAESADNATANPSTRLKMKVSTASGQVKLVPVMPDFRSYPTTRLKVEVAKFGFKDMKTRDRMVSCLERCWEAKNKAATARSTPQQPETNAGPVENTAGLPKQGPNGEETAVALQKVVSTEILAKGKRYTRRRSKSPKRRTAPKSKKSSSKAPSHDDDDLDAIDLSVKPGSRKPTPTPKPRARKTPVTLKKQKSYAAVHDRISEAVHKSGQTESDSSFYHAILMYDPIVLEDITLWLNTKEELRDLCIDEEVVKAWCEANGVCCVRNETLAGKERKRF